MVSEFYIHLNKANITKEKVCMIFLFLLSQVCRDGYVECGFLWLSPLLSVG